MTQASDTPTRTYCRVDIALGSQWRVGTWGVQDATSAADAGPSADRTMVAIARHPKRAGDPGRDGDPYLPASSVRGALRAHLVATLDADRTAETFGPEPPEDRDDAEELLASPWWVLAARLPAGSWKVKERGQTAIHRGRRAPQRGSMRTAETVHPQGPGPHVQVYLRCDSSGDRTIVDDVLDALPSWTPRIGAGRSTGLGRATVMAVSHHTITVTDRSDLLHRLEHGNNPAALDALVARGTVLVVRSGDVAGAVADDVVLTADYTMPHGWEAETPRTFFDGSTWKGLIRSRVEFIARSLTLPVCGHKSNETPTAGEQPNERHSPEDDPQQEPATSPSGVRHCGRCDVCAAFGSPDAAGNLEFDITPVDRTDIRDTERLRVAINRFTGGARDEALFPERQEHGAKVTLVIRGTGPIPTWVARATLHAVRDLGEGLIGVGRRSGTGLGTLETRQVAVHPSWAPHLPAGANRSPLTLDDIAAIPVHDARGQENNP